MVASAVQLIANEFDVDVEPFNRHSQLVYSVVRNLTVMTVQTKRSPHYRREPSLSCTAGTFMPASSADRLGSEVQRQ
jgi:hypothetical protein